MISASSLTNVPLLSTLCPSTYTTPAMMDAFALSLPVKNPFFTRSRSNLSFNPTTNPFCQTVFIHSVLFIISPAEPCSKNRSGKQSHLHEHLRLREEKQSGRQSHQFSHYPQSHNPLRTGHTCQKGVFVYWLYKSAIHQSNIMAHFSQPTHYSSRNAHHVSQCPYFKGFSS